MITALITALSTAAAAASRSTFACARRCVAEVLVLCWSLLVAGAPHQTAAAAPAASSRRGPRGRLCSRLLSEARPLLRTYPRAGGGERMDSGLGVHAADGGFVPARAAASPERRTRANGARTAVPAVWHSARDRASRGPGPDPGQSQAWPRRRLDSFSAPSRPAPPLAFRSGLATSNAVIGAARQGRWAPGLLSHACAASPGYRQSRYPLITVLAWPMRP